MFNLSQPVGKRYRATKSTWFRSSLKSELSPLDVAVLDFAIISITPLGSPRSGFGAQGDVAPATAVFLKAETIQKEFPASSNSSANRPHTTWFGCAPLENKGRGGCACACLETDAQLCATRELS